MQFTNFIVLSLGAIASVNAVDCWKSGPTVSVSNISPSVETVCNYLAAVYTKHEERYQCVQDLGGVKWDFALTVSTIPIVVWRSDELTEGSLSATLMGGQSRLPSAKMA